jgi:ABC-2 type transport system ATP-binding protein
MPVVEIESVTYRYGERAALSGVTFGVEEREVFALLGPNGSGKTTLFRILSTLYPPDTGTVRILGFDVREDAPEVRRRIGVVFQNPSLDKKLTVRENLTHHGHLYGMSGRTLGLRIDAMLGRLRIADRAEHRVETLSGGLARRVELAKGLLHQPALLILDEPSVGLDPGARHDLWAYLDELRKSDGVTVLVTTHLIEEADRATRVLVLHEGRVVALDTPSALKAEIGGDIISLATTEPGELSSRIGETFGLASTVVGGAVRLEQKDGHVFIPRLFESFPRMIRSVTLARPTLEDVFIARTGHQLGEDPR